jgi:hypothetical protein
MGSHLVKSPPKSLKPFLKHKKQTVSRSISMKFLGKPIESGFFWPNLTQSSTSVFPETGYIGLN